MKEEGGRTMPTIRLASGTEVRVSPQDHDYLSRFNWCQFKGSGRIYRKERVPEELRRDGREYRTLMMHREIAGVANQKQQVVFADGDPTNCTRENLVIQPRGIQGRQQKPRGSSPYRGVSWNKVRLCWQSHIRAEGKLRFLGFYPAGEEGEIAGARAYDEAARRYHGARANLNFPLRKRRRLKDEVVERRAAGAATREVAPVPAAAAPPVATPVAVDPVLDELYRKPYEQLTPDEIARLKAAFFSGGERKPARSTAAA
jgi:hypothetical protein